MSATCIKRRWKRFLLHQQKPEWKRSAKAARQLWGSCRSMSLCSDRHNCAGLERGRFWPPQICDRSDLYLTASLWAHNIPFKCNYLDVDGGKWQQPHLQLVLWGCCWAAASCTRTSLELKAREDESSKFISASVACSVPGTSSSTAWQTHFACLKLTCHQHSRCLLITPARFIILAATKWLTNLRNIGTLLKQSKAARGPRGVDNSNSKLRS